MAHSTNDCQDLAVPSTPAAQPSDDSIFGGSKFGNGDVQTLLANRPSRTESKYTYLYIALPLGAENDNLGYGQVHRYNQETFRIDPWPTLDLRVRFPVGRFTGEVLDKMPEKLSGRFPVKNFSALEISLHDGAFVEVDGFGLPFHNPGHDADDWINKGSVVASSMTFIDILRQRKWHIIVKENRDRFKRLWEESLVPAPFTFPYGNEHSFDLARYESQFKEAVSKGSQFPLSVNFPDASSMQSAITQSAVQDCLWIAIEVAKIFAKKHPAYFIPTQQDAVNPSRFFAIVSMGVKYRKSIGNVWSNVTKDGFLRLAFHQDMSPMDTPSLVDHGKWHKCAKSIWNAKIIEKANSIPVLKDHPLKEYDLVLLVQRPREFKDAEITKTCKVMLRAL